MLTISNSKAATARGCWKKYQFKYEYGIEPIRQAHYLTLGKVIHNSFEDFYNGKSDDDCLANIETTFNEEIAKADPMDVEDLRTSQATALGMWENYPHKRLDNFESIDPEVSFDVRLGNLRGVRVNGRVDGLVTKDKKLFVREMKTTGLDWRQFEGRMLTSGQASTYIYGCQKAGHPVVGVMYDVIRKPRLYKRQNEDAVAFGKRLRQDYKWRGDFYYQRHWEYRNPEQIKLFEQDMITFAKELRDKKRCGGFYRNPEQCWNFNAECPYLKICFQDKPDKLTLELFYKKKGKDDA